MLVFHLHHDSLAQCSLQHTKITSAITFCHMENIAPPKSSSSSCLLDKWNLAQAKMRGHAGEAERGMTTRTQTGASRRGL